MDEDEAERLDRELERIENARGPKARSWQDEQVLTEMLEFSDSDDDKENKKRADGTRERNLILWEAATWKQKIFAVFESASFNSDMSQFAESFSFYIAASMVLIILISCFTVIVESYPDYHESGPPVWIEILEVISVVIFTYDLILRLITCPDRYEFCLDILNLVDLVAVIPFYLEQIEFIRVLGELRILRVLRLARIVRVFRLLNIHSIPGMASVLAAIEHSFMGILLFLAIGTVLIISTSTAFFFAERGTRIGGVWWRCHKWADPELCATRAAGGTSPFQSIVDAFWWAFNTMGTVGLGDVYPVTPAGEVVACITMLLAVFLLALPTMLLTGNLEAFKNRSRILSVSWVKLSERQGKLRKSDLESPRTQIIRKMGWNDDEGKEFDEDPAAAAAEQQQQQQQAASVNLNATMSLREAAKARSKLRRKRRAERVGRPVGSVQFGGHTVEVFRRQGRANQHRYFYDPLFRIAVCDDGAPVITIIRGRCTMPTVARLQLELDHPELRKAVMALVEQLDPIGTVACDLGGGFEIHHFCSARAVTPDGVPAWDMQNAVIAPHYRNSDCAVYFCWTQCESLLTQMGDDDVAELALSHIIGSSLHIRALLPVPAVTRRIPVEQQIIHHTRFQRELSVIARRANDNPAAASSENDEMVAFVSKATLQTMLEGVNKKIIIDPMMRFERPELIDLEVADRLMSRLREMKVSQVPAACKESIYDADLLGLDDVVHEVPMSLFDADVADEVEEDALGYIDAPMLSVQARCIRVDIKMEFDVPDL